MYSREESKGQFGMSLSSFLSFPLQLLKPKRQGRGWRIKNDGSSPEWKPGQVQRSRVESMYFGRSEGQKLEPCVRYECLVALRSNSPDW